MKNWRLSRLPINAVSEFVFRKWSSVASRLPSIMPAARNTTKHHDRRSNDPNYESRVQDALQYIFDGRYKSFREAQRLTGVSVNLKPETHDVRTKESADSSFNAL